MTVHGIKKGAEKSTEIKWQRRWTNVDKGRALFEKLSTINLKPNSIIQAKYVLNIGPTKNRILNSKDAKNLKRSMNQKNEHDQPITSVDGETIGKKLKTNWKSQQYSSTQEDASRPLILNLNSEHGQALGDNVPVENNTRSETNKDETIGALKP